MLKLGKVLDGNTGLCSVVGENPDIEYFLSKGFSELNVEQSEIDFDWYLEEKLETPEYLAELAEIKAKRVKELTVTKRVFALALKEKGVSYSQLKTLIASNEDALLEWDLCVELERKNPLLDSMCQGLGITSEELDQIFKAANGLEA